MLRLAARRIGLRDCNADVTLASPSAIAGIPQYGPSLVLVFRHHGVIAIQSEDGQFVVSLFSGLFPKKRDLQTPTATGWVNLG